MSSIAPNIVGGDEYDYQYCYATRWNYNLSRTETPAHVMGSFRSAFTALTDDQFRWTPYDDIIHLLPNDCRSGKDIWAYSGWVIFWSTVEPHLAHWVARQFGYIQAIPISDGLMSPQEHAEVHAIKMSGGRNTDWVHKHQRYIADWNNRHNKVFQGIEGATTTGNYMLWYFDRTVLCVTNPGHRGYPNQYPPWGVEQQLYRDGFREIYDRARNLIEREPTQSHILQDFVRIPRDVMQMTQTGGRMSYASQNFEFPSSAYHHGAPRGGYHHGAPSGGYHHGAPSGGYHHGAPSGGYHHGAPSGGYHHGAPSGGYHMATPGSGGYHHATPGSGGYHQATPGSGGYHQATPGSGIPSPIGNFFTPSQSPPLNMFSMDGTERYATTNLENDDDRRDTELPLTLQRGRRDIIPPRCGTGGHRRHQP